MQSNARTKAKQFLAEYKLKAVTLESIRSVLKQQGYTIIEFNNIFNDEQVATLIDALRVEKNTEQSKAFTYVDRYRRLVFLNEDLSDDEKLVVLAHEEGHIYCNHFTATPIIGKDVVEEHEANEITHYILNPSLVQRWITTIKQHKKAAVISLALCLAILIGALVFASIQKEKSYYGEFYLTSSGNRYHQDGCIFVKDKTTVHRMTVDEFLSGDYEPCGICLPEGHEPIPE